MKPSEIKSHYRVTLNFPKNNLDLDAVAEAVSSDATTVEDRWTWYKAAPHSAAMQVCKEAWITQHTLTNHGRSFLKVS